MDKELQVHGVIESCLNKGQTKSAIFYANSLEGEDSVPELEFILLWCLEHLKINDAAAIAGIMERDLDIAELECLFRFLNRQDWPEQLSKLRKTDNLPSFTEFMRIFAPLGQVLEKRKGKTLKELLIEKQKKPYIY